MFHLSATVCQKDARAQGESLDKLLGRRVDLRRFCGLFETENSARKGKHCHEQTRPTHQNFAEKLFGWLELPMRNILSLGSPVRLVSATVPLGVGSTKMRSTAASEKG